MSRAVVLQTGCFGDVVLTTPLLDALARAGGPVDVVTLPSAAPLLETHPAVGRVIADDKRGATRGPRGMAAMARALRAGGYRAAYLPHRSLRSALVARLARIPQRVGFADAPGRWLYTTRVPRVRSHHEGARLAALASRAGSAAPAGEGAPLSIALTPADRAAAGAALGAAGVDGPFVALAPGARWATKRWPYYDRLAQALAARGPVVAVGAAPDRGAAPAAVDLCGRLALRETVAVIERAAVLVANDSFAMHAAQAVRTPVVALFGPTTAEQGLGPRGVQDRTVGLAGLPCRPCGTHGHMRCPLGHHRCMVELPVDVVRRALDGVLRAEP